ncbi:MAG: leucine-rich repeat domain-containing protein [Bacteroidales bacterium]|nr:leucine-rich repeat domain-containing protein [Bacteroidales bacterium]
MERKHLHIVLAVLCLVLPVLSCQKDPAMELPESITSDYPGGEYTITVRSNVPWTVYATYQTGSENNWIHFDRTEGESGTSQLVVHVDPSFHYTRAGAVVFELEKNAVYQSVQVHQQGKLDREMSDLFSPEFWNFMMERHLVHQALDRNIGKIWYHNILDIKKLDLSGQTFDFMADLAFFEQLEELNVMECGLTEFTTPMPSLKTLNCAGNRLTSLDPELFPSLEILDCARNPIHDLDVLSMTRLKNLYCWDTAISELAIGPSIEALVCGESDLERIDLSRAAGISNFNCNQSLVKELDFSHTNVYWIDCMRNPELQTLILPQEQQIGYLLAGSCRITGELTISSENIKSVLLENNQLNGLRFTESAAPEDVCIANNRIEELVLPNTSNLHELDCKNNLLTEVGVLPRSIDWSRLFLTGNPGIDGVFTVYIDGDVPLSQLQSHVPASWEWNGSTVVMQVKRVRR